MAVNALIIGRRYLEGEAYFKVREMSNVKFRNLAIFPLKIKTKHKFSLSINQI